MATPTFHEERHPAEQTRRTEQMLVGGGTTAEAVAGLAAGTLAVLGLAGVVPFYMTTIGVIAAGTALFIEGVSIGSAYAKLVYDRQAEATSTEEMEVGAGFGAQGLGGAAAIVLGILSLVRVMPDTLLPIAIMALGAALLLGGPARAELNWSMLGMRGANTQQRYVARQTVVGTASILALVGIGAIVLGILGLVTVGETFVLTLVGLLAIGGAELLGGSALLGRFAVGMRHH